ncbi:hypothetical protein ARMA_0021 [Ardenticatena maritima]|uniref:Uncharacterized protein n=1 Tax=Ardenticatena maritima TaxID=872965 RepID=A0A0M9UBC3_9CHLR|nr:hypothetical protein ARMA_0021 [Ardenticatena maritima]
MCRFGSGDYIVPLNARQAFLGLFLQKDFVEHSAQKNANIPRRMHQK